MKKIQIKQFIALLSIPILILILVAMLPGSAHAVPLYQSFTEHWIREPWQWVMWIVNILAVIILIAISVATVLRVENLYYKRLLPSLIIGIVMANLSFLICRLLVDVVQVPTGWLINTPPLLNAENMMRLFGMDWNNFASTTAFGAANLFIPTLGISFVLSIIIAFIFMAPVVLFMLILSFLLWARIAVIYFLVVLSPIAFFSAFIPILQKIWLMWWDWFLKWLLLGFLVVLVLKIGIMLTGQIQTLGGGTTILRWLLGIVTLILAVYYIPFKFMPGGIMGSWFGGGQRALGYGGFFGGRIAEKIGTSGSKLGGRAGRAFGWIGKQGGRMRALSAQPYMLKDAEKLPYIGGFMAGEVKNTLEKDQPKALYGGTAGAIAGLFRQDAQYKQWEGDFTDQASKYSDVGLRNYLADPKKGRIAALMALSDEDTIKKVARNGEEAAEAVGFKRQFEKIRSENPNQIIQEAYSNSLNQLDYFSQTDPTTGRARDQKIQQHIARNPNVMAGLREDYYRFSRQVTPQEAPPRIETSSAGHTLAREVLAPTWSPGSIAAAAGSLPSELGQTISVIRTARGAVGKGSAYDTQIQNVYKSRVGTLAPQITRIRTNYTPQQIENHQREINSAKSALRNNPADATARTNANNILSTINPAGPAPATLSHDQLINELNNFETATTVASLNIPVPTSGIPVPPASATDAQINESYNKLTNPNPPK